MVTTDERRGRGSIAVSTAGPGGPAWLTGGTFGPKASLFALILVSVVTLGALSTARKAGHFTGQNLPSQPPHQTG
jgi:hypothetical protein